MLVQVYRTRKKCYSTNYMKNMFPFIFIVKLEYNDIKILFTIKIVNYTHLFYCLLIMHLFACINIFE